MIEFESLASSSASNLYVVRDEDGARLMIECGLGASALDAATGFRTSFFDAALVSHHHADHSRSAAHVAGRGVTILGSAATLAAVDLGRSAHRAKVVEPGRPVHIASRFLASGKWIVTPFGPLAHDAEGNLGFAVERVSEGGRWGGRLMYACDTAYLRHRPPRGLTHLAVECNFSEALLAASDTPPERCRRLLKNHMSLERLVGWLRRCRSGLGQLREVWLLHLSAGHSNAEGFAAAVAAETGVPTFVAPAVSGRGSRPTAVLTTQ